MSDLALGTMIRLSAGFLRGRTDCDACFDNEARHSLSDELVPKADSSV